MSLIKLPGLIDLHVHLRDPGETNKEDFYSGTSAAAAGGVTTVCDMPNNKEPITTVALLKKKIKSARKKIVCDVGFYFGTDGRNTDQFKEAAGLTLGLKLYLNKTTGNMELRIKNNESRIMELHNSILNIFLAWNCNKPILLHAEEDTLSEAMEVVRKTGKKTHVCHVSSKDELLQVMQAKKDGLPVTCGVTPHHLFLTADDVKLLGPFGLVKPNLKPKKDVDYLWKNLKYIDVVESDHAPHSKEEKMSTNPPFGVPGLKTMLPLLLTAVHENRLSLDDVIRLTNVNPQKILGITQGDSTYIEVDRDEEWVIENKNLKTKCAWSPFAGWKVRGRVLSVFIRDREVYNKDQLSAKPGSGACIENQ